MADSALDPELRRTVERARVLARERGELLEGPSGVAGPDLSPEAKRALASGCRAATTTGPSPSSPPTIPTSPRSNDPRTARSAGDYHRLPPVSLVPEGEFSQRRL
jgi:hypothetical protein